MRSQSHPERENSNKPLRLVAAVVCGMASIVCLCLLTTALVREEWANYDVLLRPEVVLNTQMDRYYYARFRGIFHECLKDKNAMILTSATYEDKVKNTRCFEIDLGHLGDSTSRNSDYWFIIRLRQTHIGLIGTGMLSVLVGGVICFTISFWKKGVKGILFSVAAICFLLSAVTTLASQIVFQSILILETYHKSPALPTLNRYWPGEVLYATTFRYGSMFYIVWGAVVLPFAAAIFISAAFIFSSSLVDKQRRLNDTDSIDMLQPSTSNRQQTMPQQTIALPMYTSQHQQRASPPITSSGYHHRQLLPRVDVSRPMEDYHNPAFERTANREYVNNAPPPVAPKPKPSSRHHAEALIPMPLYINGATTGRPMYANQDVFYT